ncbi:MAG: EAL domain-containing protein [Christensenellaceae bacterium]|nr:EAL domain-containing protein [Christensenellaceae bacterium]
MFQILVAIYGILIAAMVGCIGIILNSKAKNRQSMVRLVSMAIFTAASYTMSLLIPAGYQRLAILMNGLYFIGTDWLAMILMFFVADYTQSFLPTRMPRKLLVVLNIADTISLLVNTFTQHVFTMTRVTLSWAEYWQVQYQPMQYVHLALVYLMVGHCFGLLLYRLIKAPRIYKGKFGSIWFFLCVLIVLNLINVTLHTEFDYSVMIYSPFAMAMCYFVLYASPRNLLESMHSTLVEDSVIGLFVYDDDKRCVGVNRAAKEMFDVGDDEIYQVAEQYLEDWEKEYQGDLKDVMGAERQVVRNGETMYIYVNYQKLLDDKDRVLGSGFQFEDRTDVIKQYQDNKYKATHDALTGLLNRDAFEARVIEILEESDDTYYMMCSNIKDFKLINELCGSEVGDALLLAQAEVIRTDETGNSISTRLYADKFCTLLPKSEFDEETFKQNMNDIMDRVLSIPLKTHFYFGVYEIVDRTEPVWTMCDKAMMAIDIIRGSYEQFVNFYKEDLFQRVIREKEIIGEFDKAIENGEFHMFLQPQIANDGKLVGAEALVRWIHPGKGMISPAAFIPVLEKSGLIHKLDLYMWEKAAQQLQKWRREGRENLCISVNISTKDFYLIDIHEVFCELAKKYDFDTKNLKLEITESALMKDVRKIMKNMDDLHALGYDIEIDDFGSGYSSLGMLKDIHADILKIDMIFLQDTENVERSSTILKNVISMSKELGMPVITEGVETKEHVDFLRSAGCDMFQGFYFSKPINVENFEQEYFMQTGA